MGIGVLELEGDGQERGGREGHSTDMEGGMERQCRWVKVGRQRPWEERAGSRKISHGGQAPRIGNVYGESKNAEMGPGERSWTVGWGWGAEHPKRATP